jgi:hypothetical protein
MFNFFSHLQFAANEKARDLSSALWKHKIKNWGESGRVQFTFFQHQHQPVLSVFTNEI